MLDAIKKHRKFLNTNLDMWLVENDVKNNVYRLIEKNKLDIDNRDIKYVYINEFIDIGKDYIIACQESYGPKDGWECFDKDLYYNDGIEQDDRSSVINFYFLSQVELAYSHEDQKKYYEEMKKRQFELDSDLSGVNEEESE